MKKVELGLGSMEMGSMGREVFEFLGLMGLGFGVSEFWSFVGF